MIHAFVPCSRGYDSLSDAERIAGNDACAPSLGPTLEPIHSQESVMATAAHEINWQRDVDQAIAEAGRTHRPLLLDFTAAPL
jgi:hypothetical protein